MDFRSGRPRPRKERRRTDSPELPPGQVDRRQSGLAVLRWKNRDGSEATGHPLPRPLAEALLRAYQATFPLPTFWLEIPAALPDAAARA